MAVKEKRTTKKWNIFVLVRATELKINQFIKEHWYSTKMVVRGQEFDMTEAEGVVACNEG